MSGEGGKGGRRTVVVLKEGIGYADEPALLKGDAVVVGEDAVGRGGRGTCSWEGVSGCGGEEGTRTGEEVADVGDGLGVLEEEVVEDAGGGGEGGGVDEGRECACLRHRRVGQRTHSAGGFSAIVPTPAMPYALGWAVFYSAQLALFALGWHLQVRLARRARARADRPAGIGPAPRRPQHPHMVRLVLQGRRPRPCL